MKELTKRFLDQELSRREFAKGLTALGFSGAAVETFVSSMSVANAAELVPHEGLPFQGSGGEILAECLRAAGAEYVFDVNSTGQTSFYDALATRPELKMIVALQEGQAVSMAHGYELASGRPGMLVLPSIGIPNSLSNLYNAWKDRSALVVFSDGSDTETAGRDGFQQVDDWLAPTEAFTKWRWSVDHPERIAEMARRGIKLAATPAGGPVYVRLPKNILSATDVETTIYPQSAFNISMQMDPKPELIEAAARLLVEAQHPMINAGAEITRAGANAELLELAELLSARVTQGYSVYGDFPFQHPLFSGHYSMGFPRGLLQTDVFLNLGAPMPDPTIVTAAVPAEAKVINARIEYDRIANLYPTDIAIAAGLRETTRALIDAVTGMTTRRQREKLKSVRFDAAAAELASANERMQRRAKRGWDAAPMYSERLCFEMEQILDDDATVVVETGDRSPQNWMNFGPGRKSLIGPTTGFALGWSIGASLGVKIARPDQQVVALVGDGAALFGQLEALWTASRYDIPVIMVVFNNRSYDSERGRIHFMSAVARQDKSAWKDMSCYLGDPVVDFVSVAKGFEIEGGRISGPDEIKTVFERAFAVNREGRPFLIDAQIAQRGPGADLNWHPGVSIGARS
jgi:thiamine pyrophosphate-dependent acetolactate synthase large subunit-like protein